MFSFYKWITPRLIYHGVIITPKRLWDVLPWLFPEPSGIKARWISTFKTRAVRGEALLGSFSWLSTVKQMCGQMTEADGRLRLESRQPVGPSQPHNQRTGWSDGHDTHWTEATFLVGEASNRLWGYLEGGDCGELTFAALLWTIFTETSWFCNANAIKTPTLFLWWLLYCF